MLTLNISGVESFDEQTQEFVTVGDQKLMLEHSLFSLSKWESIWEIPFFGKEAKTAEQTISYIECMSVSEFPPGLLSRLNQENLDEVQKYIDAKMTATTFNETNTRAGREIVTSEIVYYWMVAQQIPFECQHWHFNRLLTLIKVVNNKNAPAKKMNRRDAAAQQRALNASRRAEHNTSG